MTRFSAPALSATALVLGLAACGGSAGGGSGTVTQAADQSGNLKFDNSSLTAKAGNVTIKFTNASMLPHNFTI